MKKLDKQSNQFLKEIAAKLPKRIDKSMTTERRVTGEQIISAEIAKDINQDTFYKEHGYILFGEKKLTVYPDKTYRYPITIYVDHFKKLKKAFKKDREAGINKYLESLKTDSISENSKLDEMKVV